MAIFLVSLLSLVYYILLGREVKPAITEQLLKQEQTLVRAEAGNITSFFQAFGSSVAILANSSNLEDPGTKALHDMDIFVEQWKKSGVVPGVILTDEFGVVQLSSSILDIQSIGESVSDREYFLWANSDSGAGEYFIGRPVVSRLGESEGQTIIPVASPIYKDGVFAGAVVAAVKLEPLSKRFFGLIKVSGNTDVYLLDVDGDILYDSTTPVSVGENVTTTYREAPFLGSNVVSENIEYVLENFKEGTFQTDSRLVAYSPISLGKQKWLLISSSPSHIVAEQASPLYIRQVGILLFTALTVVLFGVFAAREEKISILGENIEKKEKQIDLK
jgi:C4-dicarboxylate-specific signal transduction histidine kinase